MAQLTDFTDAERSSLADILGIDDNALTRHLNLVITNLPDSTVTKIKADVVTWDANVNEYVKVHPNDANFGVEVDPARIKQGIISRTARRLSFNTAFLGSSGIARLSRS